MTDDKKRQALIDKNNHLFLRSLKTAPDGAHVLDDLVEKFYKQTSFVRGEPDTTAYKEGQRSVVIYCLDRIERAEKKA